MPAMVSCREADHCVKTTCYLLTAYSSDVDIAEVTPVREYIQPAGNAGWCMLAIDFSVCYKHTSGRPYASYQSVQGWHAHTAHICLQSAQSSLTHSFSGIVPRLLHCIVRQ